MDAIIDSLTNTNTQLQTEALQKLLAIAQRSDLISLKSLIENKSTLTEIYNCHSMSPENKRILADILSSIYMMHDQQLGLTYRKLGNVVEIGSFGHQFVKKVLATIKRSKTQNDVDVSLIIDSLNFLFSHNCECDAVDFLIELGLIGYVNYFENERVEMYLLELAAYVELEHVLFDYYRRKKEWVKMVCLMIKMKGTYELNEIEDTDEKEMIENDLHKVDINEKDMYKRDENNNIEANASNAVDQNNKDTNNDNIGDNISISANTSNSEDSLRRTFYANNTKKLFNVKMRKERIDHEEEVKLSCETLNKAFIYTKTDFKSDLRYILSVCNDTQFIQILFILSRCNVMVDEEMINSLGRMTEKALKVINNAMLPSINAFLHKDLQIIEPFEIGKFLKGVPKIDKDVTLKDFIPVCISNAFVHFGFAYDSLLFTKEHEYNVDLNVICEKDTPELMTVISMLGLIKRNKNENAGEYLTIYDDLLESFAFSNGFSYKKSGALLAYALSQNSYDPDHFLLPLLLEDLGSDCCMMNISSFLGIQHLYFGSAFEMTRDTIEPLLYSSKIETVGMGVFTLGSIFCGSMKGEMIDLLCSVLVERREESGSIFYLSAVLGYSLLFVGVKDRIAPYEEFMKEIGVLDVVRGFAYLGTGRTDVIEELVHNYLGCEETPVENVKKGLILMSIALICLNDHTTREMAKRMLINLQSKDKSNAVPLALGLLYASDPEVEVIDALSRSINMPNPITSIVGLGIVGAGTNNTRICSLLQQQYAYFKKSKLNAMLKIAQGLVCLGKGTLTLSPLMYEKSMINVKAITNLYATCIFFLGDSYPLVEKHGFMFSMLGSAISNKFCVAMDGDLNFKSVDIRIGRPVYTNNMPGKKRGMSAVVVHESPVIVQVDEKADIYEEENGYYGYCEDVIVIKEGNNE